MWTRALPWILAAGFAVSTGALAMRGGREAADEHRDEAAPTASPADSAVTASPGPLDLAPLRQCRSRLEVTLTRLSRCELAAPAAGGAAATAATAATAAADPAEPDEAARRAARDGRRATVRHSVEEFLAITPEQSQWVQEFVCAVRGLRADVIAELRAGTVDLAAAAAKQKLEREETLVDLEQFLGAEKYSKLRSVGGLGKLGDLFECD